MQVKVRPIFRQVMLFYHPSNKDWGLSFLDPFVLSPITLTDLNKPELLHPKVPFSHIYFKSSKFTSQCYSN